MPRVSPEHLDARRRQILAAARACFVRDGFHATSMQDILREARLSAGAVYRYFPSKDAIVVAIASEAIQHVAIAFTAMLETEPLPALDQVLAAPLTAIERLQADEQTITIVIQVWGEAVRNPPLQAQLTDAIDEMIGTISDLVRRYQEQGVIDPESDPRHVASVLIGLVQGFIVQHALLSHVTGPAYREGIHALLDRPGHAPAS